MLCRPCLNGYYELFRFAMAVWDWLGWGYGSKFWKISRFFSNIIISSNVVYTLYICSTHGNVAMHWCHKHCIFCVRKNRKTNTYFVSFEMYSSLENVWNPLPQISVTTHYSALLFWFNTTDNVTHSTMFVTIGTPVITNRTRHVNISSA